MKEMNINQLLILWLIEKKKERERQSIMERGPAGSWNPLSGGFYVGAAKLAVGIGTSFLDPINIGASFIPIYGQARFARSIAKAKGMGVKSAKAFRRYKIKKRCYRRSRWCFTYRTSCLWSSTKNTS